MNIPDHVIEDLAEVRESGLYNMLDKPRVAADTGINTQDWLADNPDRYMEALKEMGKRRSK